MSLPECLLEKKLKSLSLVSYPAFYLFYSVLNSFIQCSPRLSLFFVYNVQSKTWSISQNSVIFFLECCRIIGQNVESSIEPVATVHVSYVFALLRHCIVYLLVGTNQLIICVLRLFLTSITFCCVFFLGWWIFGSIIHSFLAVGLSFCYSCYIVCSNPMQLRETYHFSRFQLALKKSSDIWN